jgi:hypothetical protein
MPPHHPRAVPAQTVIVGACVALLATACAQLPGQAFYVFLSNRVCPGDKGKVLPLYTRIGTLAAESAHGFELTKVQAAGTRSAH